ncbi:TIGR01777 family protein [Mycobacterium intermedium]|uniref:TIGR01777 family protein n=1 Tax=Mycobacterium intermedium TaxID=28445 RepID=A0A1E3S6Y7_MYCIE|nr:TIGR01777 family oxidoreductase [Mycobacterium intermedium]MCV6967962.1 TIGR01777 family protein [Mycobacterium intermedium]ODQ97908.1 TIGR01777 family protein [Mycobacterium intermedium]OPE48717.1 TIGR01777 family protein [Mycobacterium intermedium]ORA97806.1 TIGR01777 family protein [Mycobacterium intermedium]
MGLEYATVVDAPRDDVFDWHARPGAFTRLSPPWQPMRLVSEAESVKDGRAILALPGGLRWIAQHQAGSYDPPTCFVDDLSSDGLASLPPRIIRRWRHTHLFEDAGPNRTRVIDRLDTPVPAFALRPMFAYRHRQLADDLAAHQLASEHGLTPLTIAVTGASGLVGTALTAFLSTGGHRVIRLVRRQPQSSLERRWDPAHPDADLLTGVDALVHLAGASIAGRFTEKHRNAIRDSRIGPTRRLAELVTRTSDGPKVFVCASAIGYYGYDRGDETLSEDSDRGDGLLADVVVEWEEATSPATQIARVVQVRTGIVQSPAGGTLRLMRPLFSAGLGGRLGSGQQWLSWIGIDDLVDVYHRALWDTTLAGPVNAVAPQPVRNADYTRTLARVLRRPAVLPVPALGPRVLLGEQGARELACASQRVEPHRLAQAGHRFRWPDLDPALRHLLGRNR